MSNQFVYTEKGDLGVYQVSSFIQTGLDKHGFTTRKGGVSPAPFAQLNLAFHTGDVEQNVVENRRILSSAFNLDLANWSAGKQVHSDRVAVITAEDKGKGAWEYQSALEDTDALVTNVPGIVLTSYHADCVAIFLWDPKRRVVGVAHAGWRGTVERIGVKTLQKMQTIYGSLPEDCLIAIGPSIGPCCFEVDGKVAEPWKNSFSYWQEVMQEKGSGKWLIDLWETNKRQFLEAGVPLAKIAVSQLCTFCRTDLFFSYRAEQGKTGRMTAFISL